MNKKTPLDQITEIAHLLPREVLDDVYYRLKDWLASGGEASDPYIEQQLRFAKRFIEKGESQ